MPAWFFFFYGVLSCLGVGTKFETLTSTAPPGIRAGFRGSGILLQRMRMRMKMEDEDEADPPPPHARARVCVCVVRLSLVTLL